MSVSFNPFSRCFPLRPEPTPLDQALPLLQRAGLDNFPNRQKIQSEWSKKIVERLAEANCLTQPIVDKLLLSASDYIVARALSQLPIAYIDEGNLNKIFPTPENVPDAAMAIDYLHQADLIQEANFNLFSLGDDVAVGLGLLARNGLLTERNLDAVIAYPWMGTAFSDKMSEWDNADTLTQPQLDEFLHTEDLDTDLQQLVLDCFENIAQGRGASVEHRQCAIRVLRQRGTLTPENRLDILEHPDRALFVAMIYNWLVLGGILNPGNKDIVLNKLSIRELEAITTGALVADRLCSNPTQLVTQDIFDHLLEKPAVAIQVMSVFAVLVNAGLFNPEMHAEIFSRLRDNDSLPIGVGILVDDNALNEDNFADLMADPHHASEIALLIVCGFDRSAREQIMQGQATPELLTQPGCIKLKKHLHSFLQKLDIAFPENQAIVDQLNPLDASRVMSGLVGLQQGLLIVRRMFQVVSMPLSLPTDMDEMQSFMQKAFNTIIAHPEHALPAVQLHLALQVKIPPQYHEACFTHLENVPDIVRSLEIIGKNELLEPQNLMEFLSDDQAHVSKIAAFLTKCRSLDQPGFERIVASVKSGEAVSAQSLELDVGLRRRQSPQGYEMKV